MAPFDNPDPRMLSPDTLQKEPADEPYSRRLLAVLLSFPVLVFVLLVVMLFCRFATSW